MPGELLIKFKPETSSAQRQAVLALRGAELIRHFSTLGIDHVRLTSSRGVSADAKAFAADAAILYAQPNFIRHITGTDPPNDPRWLSGEMWGLDYIGAGTAWRDFTSGSGNVVVVDIDTGVNYNHPDLAANIWTNPGEIPGNGIDDDGDGYIDDVHGINPVYRGSDPIDDEGHGTHTAGTIGAVGNNGIGVVGVIWKVQIIACKAFDWRGNGADADIVACFDYTIALKQRGINIRATNNSYSGERDPDPANFSFALKDVFDRAGAAGIVNVCAAGNGGDHGPVNIDQSPFDPASFDSVGLIAVAGSNSSNERAWFSNWGPVSVALAAPGQSILSTIHNDYDYLSGTSMATPHVTGTIALLAEELPDLSVDTAKSLVMNNVTTFPQWSGVVASGGRLNLYDTLHSAMVAKTSFRPSSMVVNLTSSSFQLTWPSAPGMRYRVYATDNLTSGFTALSSILTAAAGQTSMTYTDSAATPAPKFYEVRTVP